MIFDRTGYEPARQEAVKAYRLARAAWAEMANRVQGVYVADITFGGEPQLRGNWMDRLAAIDKDIAAMASIRPAVSAPGLSESKPVAAVAAVLAKRARRFPIEHTPPKTFRPGEAIALSFQAGQGNISEARLWYRHVNQAEIYVSPIMQREGNSFLAAIPGSTRIRLTRCSIILSFAGGVKRGFIRGSGRISWVSLILLFSRVRCERCKRFNTTARNRVCEAAFLWVVFLSCNLSESKYRRKPLTLWLSPRVRRERGAGAIAGS